MLILLTILLTLSLLWALGFLFGFYITITKAVYDEEPITRREVTEIIKMCFMSWLWVIVVYLYE